MLTFSLPIFEDFLVGQTALSTGSEHARLLSLADQLAIQVLTWKVVGVSPTFTLAIEHSMDGRRWVARSGTPEILTQPLSLTAPTVLFGHDPGLTSRLAFTRFTLTLGTTSPTQPLSSYVRILVSGRDKAKTVPCFCDEDYKLTYHRRPPG